MSQVFPDATRIADEAIYANADGYAAPKEYFKLIAGEILADGQPASLIDVGCANGALLNHLRSVLPGLVRVIGVDPVPTLVETARQLQPTTEFVCGDLLDPALAQRLGRAEVVTMAGVLGIFFDPAEVLTRLLALTTPGGTLHLFGPFNEEAIDVQLQYRRAPDGPWETGHNLYAMPTMERLCTLAGCTWRWTSFRMPFAIAKSNDPMRSWTEPFRDDPNHLFYGTGMHMTMKLLTVRKPA